MKQFCLRLVELYSCSSHTRSIYHLSKHITTLICQITYSSIEFIISYFLHLLVNQSAISNAHLAYSVLFSQMRVINNFSSIFISEIFKNNSGSDTILFLCMVQQGQRLFISFFQFFDRTPFKGNILSDSHLPRVALTPEIDFFGMELVGNINQEYFKVLIVHQVGLEDDLYFVG